MFDIMTEYLEKFNELNNLKTRKKDKEKRKQKVLTNVSGIYNQLYYIYKNKYNKKINSLDAENKKKFDYKKLRLSDYTYPSEEEEQEDKQYKETTDVNKFNESIIKKGMDIKNMELFNKHFNYQTPSVLLKDLYTTKDKTKNDELVNVINIRLKGLKEEIEKMSKAEKEIEKPDKIVEIVEDILKFNKQ